MDQSELKTSPAQRVVIMVIAILMLAATIATYIGITLSSSNSANTTTVSNAELDKLQAEYTAIQEEVNTYASGLSEKYFKDFSGYKSKIAAFNSATANKSGVQTKDFKVGTGQTIEEGVYDYQAYYIGYCADESIFDSSFDDKNNPTALVAPLAGGSGYIQGWLDGVVGMKIGGVREITIPGELAYGDDQEICGGKNSPLRFIIQLIQDKTLSDLNKKADDKYYEMLSAYYSDPSNQNN